MEYERSREWRAGPCRDRPSPVRRDLCGPRSQLHVAGGEQACPWSPEAAAAGLTSPRRERLPSSRRGSLYRQNPRLSPQGLQNWSNLQTVLHESPGPHGSWVGQRQLGPVFGTRVAPCRHWESRKSMCELLRMLAVTRVAETHLWTCS